MTQPGRAEEAAQQKERERRQRAVAKAQSALDAARRKHEKNAADIQAQIEALEERSRAEIAHWEKEKARLEAALRRAREGGENAAETLLFEMCFACKAVTAEE
jgi:flagellar motility protein MotE (MotC chaperone)